MAAPLPFSRPMTIRRLIPWVLLGILALATLGAITLGLANRTSPSSSVAFLRTRDLHPGKWSSISVSLGTHTLKCADNSYLITDPGSTGRLSAWAGPGSTSFVERYVPSDDPDGTYRSLIGPDDACANVSATVDGRPIRIRRVISTPLVSEYLLSGTADAVGGGSVVAKEYLAFAEAKKGVLVLAVTRPATSTTNAARLAPALIQEAILDAIPADMSDAIQVFGRS
jgi:hypothetical protein